MLAKIKIGILIIIIAKTRRRIGASDYVRAVQGFCFCYLLAAASLPLMTNSL